MWLCALAEIKSVFHLVRQKTLTKKTPLLFLREFDISGSGVRGEELLLGQLRTPPPTHYQISLNLVTVNEANLNRLAFDPRL